MVNGSIKSVVVLNAFFLFSGLAAQSQDLVEMSFIQTDGLVFSVKTQGDILYLAEFRGFSSLFKSVDISNPEQPAVLDSFLTAGFITDFALNSDYAYLSMADNEFGLRILDIADPANIKEVHFLEGGESTGTFLAG